MRATDETIRQAIATYAIQLNRVAWLAEDRLLLQQQVWRRMIESETGDAPIHLTHIDAAIGALLDDNKPIDVVPRLIVTKAAELARLEHRELALMVAAYELGASPISGVISRFEATNDRETFEREKRHAISIVARSGLDPGLSGDLITTISGTTTELENHCSCADLNGKVTFVYCAVHGKQEWVG
jgi:hypothetical protein